MTQKWFTAAELAEFALPELPASSRGIKIMAKRDGWHAPERKGTWWRPRADSGGGIEYTLAVLPQAARVALTPTTSNLSPPSRTYGARPP